MKAPNFHPLFLQNKQFMHDFGAVLQNDVTPVQFEPKWIQNLLLTLEPLHYATFVDGIFSKEYSQIPEGVSIQNQAVVIEKSLNHPFHMVFLDQKTHESDLSITLKSGVTASVSQTFYGTASTLPYHRISFSCEAMSVLFYDYLQCCDEKGCQFAEIRITQEKDSKVHNAIGLASGFRSGVLLYTQNNAEGTEANTQIVTLQKDKSVAHFISHTDHVAQNGTSTIEAKSVLNDKARLHFVGKIEVQQHARNTDARLKHQSLLLSPTSEVSSEPQLEINNKNVKCAHGATVGQLDKEALFYLKSRGLPEQEAQSMLIQAFCESLIIEAKNGFWKNEMLRAVQALI